jgi:hypothetical protein
MSIATAPEVESPPGAFHEIRLSVPAPFEAQLVFRREQSRRFEVALPCGAQFVYCRTMREFLPQFRQFTEIEGRAAAVKAGIKLLTPRRSFYAMICEGRMLHYGWITTGRCRYYHVEPRAAVIGPIWTSEQARGRGLATAATQLVINEMISQGCSIFYIDTSTTNTSCLKVIQKCGFGPPLGAFVRRDSIAGR